MLDKTDGRRWTVQTEKTVKRRVRAELAAAALLALIALLLALARCGCRPGDILSVLTGRGAILQWQRGRFVYVERGENRSNDIDQSRLADLDAKTARGLASWAEMAWDNRWGYVWGTFGDVLDEDLLEYKLEQFGQKVQEHESVIRKKWMDRRTVDCAGLIKSYCWYDPGANQIRYGGGDMPDVGTDGFYDLAPEKGPIDTLPETPGLLVYAPGHIGVYVGGGWAVEAISHAGGVVKTRVADRTWTHWLQCPYIQY